MNAQDMLWDLNKSYSMWTAEEAYNNEIRWREMEKRENARILEESVATATQQGLQEGIAIGEERGITQGEHNARIETARGMLSYGMPEDKVAEISGLSIDEVQSLANG